MYHSKLRPEWIYWTNSDQPAQALLCSEPSQLLSFLSIYKLCDGPNCNILLDGPNLLCLQMHFDPDMHVSADTILMFTNNDKKKIMTRNEWNAMYHLSVHCYKEPAKPELNQWKLMPMLPENVIPMHCILLVAKKTTCHFLTFNIFLILRLIWTKSFLYKQFWQ